MSDDRRMPPPRRRTPRVNAAGLSAVLTTANGTADPIPVSLLNISESGVSILAHAPLGDVDQAFELRLGAPPESVSVECHCTIRYVLGGKHKPDEEPQWLHGAEFSALGGEASRFLGSFVRNGTAQTRRH